MAVVAALGGVMLRECGLDGGQVPGSAEALDGGDLSAVDRDNRSEACQPRLTVDQDGAGAAGALLAAHLGAEDAELLPQHLEQRGQGRAGDGAAYAVDLKLQEISLLASARGLV